MAMKKVQRVAAKRGANQPPRSRAFFLEMLLNMLIFALCSVVALQVFVEGKITTSQSEALTELTLNAESLAETYKMSDGNLEDLMFFTADGEVSGEFTDGSLIFYYDSEFVSAGADAAKHSIVLTPADSQNSQVKKIIITGYTDETELFSLEVAQFQSRGEGVPHGSAAGL